MSLWRRWKTLGEPVKAAVAFTIASLLIRGSAFLTTGIFTRLLGDEYAIVADFNSWNTILEVFALLGLTSAGVFNAGLNDYREQRDRYISCVLTLCNCCTFVVFVIICGIKAFIKPDFILPMELLIIMFVQFLFEPAQIFWMTRERYEYRYRTATLVSVGSSIGAQLLAILLILANVTDSPALDKLIGTAMGSLLFCVPIYVLLQVRGKQLFNGAIWKQVLLFALPLIPHYLAQHTMAAADRIMIGRMYSDMGESIYSVVSAIGMIATIVWSAVNASLVPYTYEGMNNKMYIGIRRVSTSLVTVYAIACVAVTLIAPEALAILAPERYAGGIYAIPPIAFTAFLNALYNLYSNVEFYHKKASGIAAATIISCIVNIILNYLLIPRFGYIGAAYTTLVSNIVLILMHYAFYRRCQPDRIYNDRMFLLIAIICFAACELCSLMYSNRWVRYGAIAAILVGAFLSRKRLKNLIISMRKSDTAYKPSNKE